MKTIIICIADICCEFYNLPSKSRLSSGITLFFCCQEIISNETVVGY